MLLKALEDKQMAALRAIGMNCPEATEDNGIFAYTTMGATPLNTYTDLGSLAGAT